MGTIEEKVIGRAQVGGNLDLVHILHRLADESAKITPQSGGFKIIVTKPYRFPWVDVFTLLLDVSFDVWLTRTKGVLNIYARYRSP